MKSIAIVMLLLSTSVFAQAVKIENSVIEYKSVKKQYSKIKIIDDLPSLKSGNGVSLTPEIESTYQKQYTDFKGTYEVVDYPTSIELDCRKDLKSNFNKAIASLGLKLQDLSKLGISEVELITVSDLDQKYLDKEILGSLLSRSGLEGRKLTAMSFLSGKTCIVVPVGTIANSLKKRI